MSRRFAKVPTFRAKHEGSYRIKLLRESFAAASAKGGVKAPQGTSPYLMIGWLAGQLDEALQQLCRPLGRSGHVKGGPNSVGLRQTNVLTVK
jgi:hypothetical protein